MVPAARVQEAVDEAVAPLLRVIHDLEQRIAELEAGLATAPVAIGATQPPAPPAPHGYPASIVPPPPVLDVAAIERDLRVPIDRALDGRRRQRRVVTTVALVIAVTLGSFFAALVYSYTSRGMREDGSTGTFAGVSART